VVDANLASLRRVNMPHFVDPPGAYNSTRITANTSSFGTACARCQALWYSWRHQALDPDKRAQAPTWPCFIAACGHGKDNCAVWRNNSPNAMLNGLRRATHWSTARL
jgi:hypothetical protein